MCNATTQRVAKVLMATYCALILASLPNALLAADPVWPGEKWATAKPADVGMDADQLAKAREYALTGGGSGYITRHGKLVISWGDAAKRYDLKSTTKSFGATALGVAIADGKMKLDDKAAKFFPDFGKSPDSNSRTGWLPKITLQHLATHTAGFEKPGGFKKLTFEPGSRWAYSDGGPNWLADCITLTYKQDLSDWMFKRVFTPIGITERDLRWRNNSYRPQKLGGVARREFGSGISANVNAMARLGYLYLRRGKWRDQRILTEEFLDAARTTVPALRGLKELDAKRFGNASDHYGLLWWNNSDGTLPDVPRDAYWSWGLHESLILVIPSLDLVAARAGKSWKRDWSGHYDVLKPFFTPIAQAAGFRPKKSERYGGVGFSNFGGSFLPVSQRGAAVTSRGAATVNSQGRQPLEWKNRRRRSPGGAIVAPTLPPLRGYDDVRGSWFQGLTPIAIDCRRFAAVHFAAVHQTTKADSKAPCPPSEVITRIEWAAKDKIIRKARGGDNWPITWGDDGHLYTAYGDGNGFRPQVPKKLSLGLCRVEGPPDKFTGINIISPTAEQTGGGRSGRKASGMLMIDGVLYMLVRNAKNAQLAWSTDRGKKWAWSDWRLTESFGHPTFLNFGKNYAGARDNYVYIYSQDHDSAYRPDDSMVMARVPKTELRKRGSYEFFAGLDRSGKPAWHKDVSRRKAVFDHRGRCYRSGISYNAGLRRYLWCQIIPGGDTRFRGGIGIYDAPEPWGPWTTVYFTEQWDVGPGECASFPPKWMSDDGKTLHMVFSGDDHFSVRQARLTVE